MADKIGYAFLFVSLVAVMLAVGLLLGMLVAGRIDRLMTPRPGPGADEQEPPMPAGTATEDDQA